MYALPEFQYSSFSRARPVRASPDEVHAERTATKCSRKARNDPVEKNNNTPTQKSKYICYKHCHSGLLVVFYAMATVIQVQ